MITTTANFFSKDNSKRVQRQANSLPTKTINNWISNKQKIQNQHLRTKQNSKFFKPQKRAFNYSSKRDKIENINQNDMKESKLTLPKNQINNDNKYNNNDQQLISIRKSEHLKLKPKSISHSEITSVRKSFNFQTKVQKPLENQTNFFRGKVLNKRESIQKINNKRIRPLSNEKWDTLSKVYLNKNIYKKTSQKLTTQAISKDQIHINEDKLEKTKTKPKLKRRTEQTIPQEQQKTEQVFDFSPTNPQYTGQVKFEIQTSNLFIVQDILKNLYQNLQNSMPIYELCLCYINIDKINNENAILNLISFNVKDYLLIRDLFVLQRIALHLIIYIERQKSKKRKFISMLIQTAFQTYRNYSILIQLALEFLYDMKKLDPKIFKPKEFNKEKKIKEIIKYNLLIKNNLFQIFQPKQLPIFQLFFNLLISSEKIQTLEYVNIIDRTLKWEILKIPSYPFLPAQQKSHTLVLDLDQTLIHFDSKQAVFHVRPYAEDFLLDMAKIFEVAIFTAGTKQYADQIIDQIDSMKNISYRLYRNHITLHEGAPVKDLSKLGRDLRKVVIVDNLSSNFRLQPDNGILISSWFGEQGDQTLERLGTVLRNIRHKYDKDLRDGLRQWNQFIKDQISQSKLICELN